MPSLQDCLARSALPAHHKQALAAETLAQRRNGAPDDLSAALAAARKFHALAVENRGALAAALKPLIVPRADAADPLS